MMFKTLEKNDRNRKDPTIYMFVRSSDCTEAYKKERHSEEEGVTFHFSKV